MIVLKQIKSLWRLESFRPDVPLARDEASRFLPWIIALMVYLAALTLAGSFTLNHTVAAGHAAQAESFSVHIPHSSDDDDKAPEKALGVVKQMPGVVHAEIVDANRIREMVEPWLGKSDVIASLPLPTIIEAKLASGASLDSGLLQNRLKAVAPGADIDDHKQWLKDFSGVMTMIQCMLLAISILILVASSAAVIFASKTSLKIHRGTVALLHRLGAYDDYIAGQFQHHAALLALKGAFVGSGFAAGTMAILHVASQHIHSPLFPSFRLNLMHWAILVLLPGLMSLIALGSARLSVLRALRKMP